MRAQPKTKRAATAPSGLPVSPQLTAGLFGLVLLGVAWIYWPALAGHFILDDLSLPFATATRDSPLSAWLPVRPVLMVSYWANYRLWGAEPLSYHAVNLLIHCLNTGLVFAVLWRILLLAGWPRAKAAWGSAIGGVVFAIHPLQTESVSYVAGRSESLAAFFLLLAYTVFLYRRKEEISWLEAGIVLLFFALGVKTKENAVSLAGILVLTDVFFAKALSGVCRNWRLYAMMIPGALIAAASVFRLLATAQTAGFSVSTYKWYEYGFTESRAIFTYLRLAVFPFGQSLDQDYAPSRTLFEHGAIFYLAALVALAAAAIIWRRRYPLFGFGVLMFLIWLAPTSSVIPIDDALVERRMYLPLLGLILIGCEAVSRWRAPRKTAISVGVLIGLTLTQLSYQRNQLWGQPDRLIELAAEHAVYNPRPMLNFTEALIRQNRCDLATAYVGRAEQRLGSNYYVNAAWGRALACLGRFEPALRRLQVAAGLNPCSPVYEWMGLVYAEMGRLEQAGKALQVAVALDPNSGSAHGTLALWYEKTNNFAAAAREYGKALGLNRHDRFAQMGLLRAYAAERVAPTAGGGEQK